LIFQTLDDKQECVGIYADGELIFSPSEFPPGLQYTWSHVPYLDPYNVEYVSLYLEGEPLPDYLPEFLKDDWEDSMGRIKAFKRSLELSKVNMRENCFYDLVPTRFLIDYCEVKNRIISHILKSVSRPRRYEFYHHVSTVLSDIKTRKVNIDKRRLRSFENIPKFRNIVKTLQGGDPYVCYNQFGTKTGRLTTNRGSFPILTLPSSLRSCVVPANDVFVELDFNGAEIRTLLGILGKEQPKEDVHRFHQEEIFDNELTREQSKVAFFAWLYGSKRAVADEHSTKLKEFYNKKEILKSSYYENTLTTPFKKVIKDVDDHHAINYLVQSTAAELLLKQSVKINHYLKSRGESFIAFLIHDSVVLDMRKEDIHLLNDIKKLMKTTDFGIYKVNSSWGRDLGEKNAF
jgi:hypothetical protein